MAAIASRPAGAVPALAAVGADPLAIARVRRITLHCLALELSCLLRVNHA